MADNYRVVNQRPVRDIMSDGTIGDVVEIAFTTKPSDQPGKVRVPMAQYDPATVNTILTSAAAKIETIQQA